jgi:serine/threonine-protein kinase RsbT
MSDEIRVPITVEQDVVRARQRARELARDLGFNALDQSRIATAVSELTRNVVKYAGQGEMSLATISRGTAHVGIEVVVRDEGPGIPNVDDAMRKGTTTGGGLGLGLPGTRRLMDEMELTSTVGKGTTVTVRKWMRPASKSR